MDEGCKKGQSRHSSAAVPGRSQQWWLEEVRTCIHLAKRKGKTFRLMRWWERMFRKVDEMVRIFEWKVDTLIFPPVVK